MKLIDTSKIIQGLIACLLSILVYMAGQVNCKLDKQAERLRCLEISQAEVVATLKLRPLGEALTSAETGVKTPVLALKN